MLGEIETTECVILEIAEWNNDFFRLFLNRFGFLEDTGKYRAMIFITPNKENVVGAKMKWSITIKRIEFTTGLDFFAENDGVRLEVEETALAKVW